MILRLLTNITALIPLLLFAGCGPRFDVISEQVMPAFGNKGPNDTLMKDSVEDVYFSRLRTPASFGLGMNYDVPEEHRNEELYVVVQGRARTNYAQSGAAIVVVAHDHGRQLCWLPMQIKYHITDLNTWCPFRDSVRVSERFDGSPFDHLSVVAHITVSQKEQFDLDSLRVIIRKRSGW